MKQDELFQKIIQEEDADRASALTDLYKARSEESIEKSKVWSTSAIRAVGIAALTAGSGFFASWLEHQNNLQLEQRKASLELIESAVTGDPSESSRNLNFLIAAGLVDNLDGDEIKKAVNSYPPSNSGKSGDEFGLFIISVANDEEAKDFLSTTLSKTSNSLEGLNVQVIKSGNPTAPVSIYAVFPTRETAAVVLKDVKKEYTDAYIKKVTDVCEKIEGKDSISLEYKINEIEVKRDFVFLECK